MAPPPMHVRHRGPAGGGGRRGRGGLAPPAAQVIAEAPPRRRSASGGSSRRAAGRGASSRPGGPPVPWCRTHSINGAGLEWMMPRRKNVCPPGHGHGVGNRAGAGPPAPGTRPAVPVAGTAVPSGRAVPIQRGRASQTNVICGRDRSAGHGGGSDIRRSGAVSWQTGALRPTVRKDVGGSARQPIGSPGIRPGASDSARRRVPAGDRQAARPATSRRRPSGRRLWPRGSSL